MRVLITGGAGFIGSHLTEKLIEEGHEVSILDNLSTGGLSNLNHLKSHPLLRTYISDVNEYLKLGWLVNRSDAVVHLAAAVGVKVIIDDPVGTIKTNVNGTDKLLSWAVKYKKRVILASTSEVYGKSTHFPYKESGDIVLGPSDCSRWGYACSKAIDEFLAMAHFKKSSLPVTIVRLFNTAGPRQSGLYGMVLPTFVRQALANEPVTVYGDGFQTRCFCHISDTVRGITGVLDDPSTVGEVYNIGSSEEVTILDLANRVINLTGSSSSVSIVPYEEAYGKGFEDMYRRLPDTTKIHTKIGWYPEYELDDIIRSIIEYQKENTK